MTQFNPLYIRARSLLGLVCIPSAAAAFTRLVRSPLIRVLKLGHLYTPSNGIDVDLAAKIVTVSGSEDFIITVAQQLAWLAAACRESTGELMYCYVEFSEVDHAQWDNFIPEFQVAFELAPLEPESQRSCWNMIVGNSVLVAGFPIAQRPAGIVGLAISLEILGALVGVPLATRYAGGYVLKGRLYMFVPVERRGDSVQWHLIQKPQGRIRYRDVEELCPHRILFNELDEEALWSTEAFLGWCPEVVNNLGKCGVGVPLRCGMILC